MQERVGAAYHFVIEGVQKTVYAGLGVVDLAQEELKKAWAGSNTFAGKLVDRGKSASEERRKMINARMERGQDQAKDLGKKANETFDKYADAVLTRANLPSSSSIQDLSKQVNTLGRKVDRLRKEQEEKVAA
jgi:polyhydroxyalkanoate synthesis regulator phasin